MDNFETVKWQLRNAVNGLIANGGTALYDALQAAVGQMDAVDAPDRIRAVVVLSDGQDTSSSATLNDVMQTVRASRDDLNPIILIPVAYGADADVASLNALARASDTRMQSGDPTSILAVLEIISSYF